VIALFGVSRYWQGFVDYWTTTLSKQTGFTMVIILVGVVGIVTIMAGRKKLDH
jgi:hypothetical protein